MAQVADEELKKAFHELHAKVNETTQKLQMADMQIESFQRSKQRAELTIAEVSSLKAETRTYESVGRMFLLDNIPSIKSNLQLRIKTSDEKIAALENNKSYLQRTLKENENNLREMVQQKQSQQSSG